MLVFFMALSVIAVFISAILYVYDLRNGPLLNSSGTAQDLSSPTENRTVVPKGIFVF
jgi:hypothetical protein